MKLVTMQTINQPIPVKYKDIIADVRERVLSGRLHIEAVDDSLSENWHKFDSLQDQDRLRAWLVGTFANIAA